MSPPPLRWALRLAAAALAAHLLFPAVYLTAGDAAGVLALARRSMDAPADFLIRIGLRELALYRKSTLVFLLVSAACWTAYAFSLGLALDLFLRWTQRRRNR